MFLKKGRDSFNSENGYCQGVAFKRSSLDCSLVDRLKALPIYELRIGDNLSK